MSGLSGGVGLTVGIAGCYYHGFPYRHHAAQGVDILVGQAYAPLAVAGAYAGGLMGAVDADAGVAGRAQAQEPGAVGAFDYSEAVAEIVRPAAGILDLLDRKDALGGLHVAATALVAVPLAGADAETGLHAAVGTVGSQCHGLFVDMQERLSVGSAFGEHRGRRNSTVLNDCLGRLAARAGIGHQSGDAYAGRQEYNGEDAAGAAFMLVAHDYTGEDAI